MQKTDIKNEYALKIDDHGAWEVIKLLIGNDFYIDVACRSSDGAYQKCKVIAHEVQVALQQLISMQEAEREKRKE